MSKLNAQFESLVQALRTLHTNKAKGELLVENFKESPKLAKIFRLAGPHIGCGVTRPLLNKALKKAGYEGLDQAALAQSLPKVSVEFTQVANVYSSADIIHSEYGKVGTATFVTGNKMRGVLTLLKNMGMEVVTNAAVRDQQDKSTDPSRKRRKKAS